MKDALGAYEGLLYQAMEFIEDIERNISRCFSPDPKRPADVSGPASLRKIIALPCNKLKHNHNRLGFVAATGLLFSVAGVAIYQARNGALQPNPEIHKDRRAFSFNVELRRILAAMYLYAEGAAAKINALSTNQNLYSGQSAGPDLPTVSILKRIAALSTFAFPFERSRHMPLIVFSDDQMTIALNGGSILPAVGNYTMMAQFEGDGATRSFTVP